jgi:predicted dehydrogenase/nucleoside-diphosphate-sugar epimerase
MRVGIIGCGQIAWVHLAHITRFKLGEVVGICDFYRPQLEKTGRGFNVQNLYTDPAEMLAQAKPDVVHVVTPPPTHADLAIQAMRAGCHVLVEKPMALSVEEADRMIAAARETGKSLCVNHNRLLCPPALQARRLLETGELGDLVSVDFYQGAGFPFWMTNGEIANQWFAKLPGGLVQDLAPHCLYSLLEFVGSPVRFHVAAKRTGLLPAAPAEEVHLTMEGERIIGTGTISLCTRPYMNYFTLYGSRMTARVNLENFTLAVKRDRFTHQLLRKSTGGIDEGFHMAAGTVGSMLRFATGKLPRYPGILEVIRRFYASLLSGGLPPVTPEQGRETVRLIQEVVAAMQEQSAERKAEAPAVISRPAADRPPILVTGATGFVGGAFVHRLLTRGTTPRALARPSMHVQDLKQLGLDVVVGDIADKAAVEAAVRGTEAVVHCAARMGTQGTWEEFYRDSIEGTENVLRAAHDAGVKRVIYVSSLGVYGTPDNGDCINDATPYDPRPDKRGNYSRAKVEAEKFVLQFANETGLPVTVFRPGFIYGRGRPLPTAPLAFPSPLSTSFIVIGSSKTLLGLNYIENLLDAFELALDRPESAGRQYIIVDDEQLTSGEYHRVRGEIDGTHASFFPGWPFRLASPGIEILAKRSNGGKLTTFTSYALARALKSVRYDTHAVREELGWRPKIGLEQALRQILERQVTN